MNKIEKMKKQTLIAINKYKLSKIEHIFPHVPFCKTTYYSYKLNQDKKITDVLEKNSINKAKHTTQKEKTIKLLKNAGKYGIGYENGYVYIIKEVDNNYYKIGVSRMKPFNRMSNMQTGNPRELEYVGIYLINNYWEVEKIIHRKYDRYNIRGEWFEFDDNMINEIKQELKANEIDNDRGLLYYAYKD
ncbi:MAG: GIY-YIG nuclease family protein [Desulfobacterales bacterium]|nr:GIY-YIG nuclease family protein [Desulfobacterales bacterium]